MTAVKKIVLWRKELDNKPGMLAQALKAFSEVGADLDVLMAYTFPHGGKSEAVVELYPVADLKSREAAKMAGFEPAHDIPALCVEAEDRPGLGFKLSTAVSEANINIRFMMCQSIDGNFRGVLGFDSEKDADRASSLLLEAAKSEVLA